MREITMVRLGELRPNPANLKRHDRDGIAASVHRLGLVDLPVLDGRTGMLVAGHGRVEALAARKTADRPPPEGVALDRDGEWLVPTVTGWASATDDEAEAAAIALNRWTERGGWDLATLAGVLERLDATADQLTGVGYDRKDLDAAMRAMQPLEFGAGSAARGEPNVGELAENYRGNGIRTLVFDYVLAEYREVAELAAAARARHRTEGNAELFMALLRRHAAKPIGA